MRSSIYDVYEEKFDICNPRYQILFSFENVYGIFRTVVGMGSLESDDYELKYFQKHESISPDDVLKDIFYLIRSGDINVCVNDVISIKINGALANYRFSGIKNHDPEQSYKNFVEIPEFLDKEKKRYVAQIHKENKILNVLEGKVYPVEKLNLKEWVFYCIDKEVFKTSDRAASIKTDYSLYVLQNLIIKQINPYPKPFITIKHALYYFNKHRQRKNLSMLLLDRHELEMIRDYYQLARQLVV